MPAPLSLRSPARRLPTLAIGEAKSSLHDMSVLRQCTRHAAVGVTSRSVATLAWASLVFYVRSPSLYRQRARFSFSVPADAFPVDGLPCALRSGSTEHCVSFWSSLRVMVVPSCFWTTSIPLATRNASRSRTSSERPRRSQACRFFQLQELTLVSMNAVGCRTKLLSFWGGHRQYQSMN